MSQLHDVIDAKPKNAVLVGVQLPGVTEATLSHSLDELARLVSTLGLKTVGRMTQRRQTEGGATVIGDGKVRELAKWTRGPASRVGYDLNKPDAEMPDSEDNDADEQDGGAGDDDESGGDNDPSTSGTRLADGGIDPELAKALGYDQKWKMGIARASGGAGGSKRSAPEAEVDDATAPAHPVLPSEAADTVVFDCELSPSQIRNLTKHLGCQVLDRTGVIIEIFSRHARTRAARLQVEIARLTYLSPRVRESSGGGDRGGGGVGAKGAGESDIELDRRKIRDRIKELRQEFESIEREYETRRSRRAQVRCVALVGYTNAGKSSMMRALTGSEVLVADKLFATLDTTVRPLVPAAVPAILISDTVGFIKKLPHDLVASFKSTLDEALNASLLLFVVDCADSGFRAQLDVTQKVLAEVGVKDTPWKLVLNKMDRVPEAQRAELRTEFPEAIMMSTKDKDDVAMLRQELIHFFEGAMVEIELFVPYTTQGAIGEIRSRMRVIEESYDGGGVKLLVRSTEAELARVKTRYGL